MRQIETQLNKVPANRSLTFLKSIFHKYEFLTDTLGSIKIKNSRIYIHFVLVMLTSCIEIDKNLENTLSCKQTDIIKRDQIHDKKYLDNNVQTIGKSNLQNNLTDVQRDVNFLLNSNLIELHDVLNYVLPYKVNNAMDTLWRRQVKQRFSSDLVPKKNITINELLSICKVINDSIKTDIKYGVSNIDESFLSYSELKVAARGSCVAMTDYTNYTFRGMGIPITTDFVYNWANVNSQGHAWNRLLLKGLSIPFMGGESNIEGYEPLVLSKLNNGEISTYRLPAKVYRISPYAEDSFDFFGKTVIDVTSEYTLVNNVIVKTFNSTQSSLYLSTFNNGIYMPATAGQVDNGLTTFNNMAINLLYFPIKFEDGRPKFAGYPIICRKEKNQMMTADFTTLIKIDVDHLLPLAQGQLNYLKKNGYRGTEESSFHSVYDICPLPIDNSKYQLYYWDWGWKIHSEVKTSDKKISFSNVPFNTVYIVKAENESLENVRPFAIIGNQIEWF